MENAPIINIGARKVQAEYFERWNNWQMSYYDWLVKHPNVRQINRYHITKENPQYNNIITVTLYDSLSDFEKARNSPEAKAYYEDQDTAWASRTKLIWYAQYQLIKSFRGGSAVSEVQVKESVVENAPIMHLEGYGFSFDEQGQYNTWVTKWGHEVYIPWLTKLPGLKEYARYQFFDAWSPYAKVPRAPAQYPPYLSILHFEDIHSYENYEKSMELAAFREAMKLPFPQDLEFKWYVQYQLMRSWRK